MNAAYDQLRIQYDESGAQLQRLESELVDTVCRVHALSVRVESHITVYGMKCEQKYKSTGAHKRLLHGGYRTLHSPDTIQPTQSHHSTSSPNNLDTKSDVLYIAHMLYSHNS